LRRFIETMDRTGGLNLWATHKNKAFQDRTGFTIREAEDAVRQLGHKNYSQGPEDDDGPNRAPGEVWMFHTEYFGEPLYMKLKLLGSTPNHTEAACLSFHEPERPMKTPLKVNGRGSATPARNHGRSRR
jgi:hypothetical protein